MKERINKTAALILALVFIVGLQTSTLADEKSSLNKKALINLITGINSENAGVRKSCIYFSGKYKVEEAVPYLEFAYENNSSESERLLILRTLYEIGGHTSKTVLEKILVKENDVKLKNMCAAIWPAIN